MIWLDFWNDWGINFCGKIFILRNRFWRCYINIKVFMKLIIDLSYKVNWIFVRNLGYWLDGGGNKDLGKKEGKFMKI